MAEADCPFCEAAGHRACDECGGPVFGPHAWPLGAQEDLCAYCLDDREKAGKA